jgi:hypothetical protein
MDTRDDEGLWTSLGPQMDLKSRESEAGHDTTGLEATELLGFRLVDLVRFELTTSSMPWKRECEASGDDSHV